MKIIGDPNVKDRAWIDYSSLSNLMKCPRSYYWSTVRSIQTLPSGPLVFGTACHDCKDAYYTHKLQGAQHPTCMDAGIKKIREAFATEGPHIDDPIHNIQVCVDTMERYFETHKAEACTTISTESGFVLDLEEFCYVGKIDRQVNVSMLGECVEETKTTKIVGERWTQRTRPFLQGDGYVAAKTIITGKKPWGLILDIIPKPRATKTKGLVHTPAFRIPSARTEEDIEMFLADLSFWWDTKKRYEDAGFWPRNTESCSPLTGYSCWYRPLCLMYPNPFKLQELKIPGEYEIREWAPFEELLQGG